MGVLDDSDKQILDDEVHRLAQCIWSYMKLDGKPCRSDVIIALGSNDPRVAERAAELFLKGYAPELVFSGYQGRGTLELYGKAEAEHFREIAIEKGVPPERISIEARATNTGENIRFTRELFETRGALPESAILVQKPYMERRARATVNRWWPGLRATYASPDLSYSKYELPWLDKAQLITMMVGDFHRILVYPQMGYQAPEDVHQEVLSAFERLVELGFGGHLVPGYAACSGLPSSSS